MAYSGLATFGYGADSTIAKAVRGGFSTAGKQYITVSALPWPATAYSILADADTPVVNGDVIFCDLLTTPGGYALTVHTDGTFMIPVNFDTARQSFIADVYDTTLTTHQGSFNVWVNNSAPVQTGIIPAISAEIGTTVTPISLNAYVVDVEGDVLTYSIAAGALPPGLTMDANGVVTGTPH